MTEAKHATPVGTFCTVIQKQLVVQSCPLPKGACIWKHRVTGLCQYSERTSDLPVAELARLVGLAAPTEDQYTTIKAALLTAIKAELKG